MVVVFALVAKREDVEATLHGDFIERHALCRLTYLGFDPQRRERGSFHRGILASHLQRKTQGTYRAALKLVKILVCTRRIGCGTASGGVMRALSAAGRKMVLFSATSFFTNLSEAEFGLA